MTARRQGRAQTRRERGVVSLLGSIFVATLVALGPGCDPEPQAAPSPGEPSVRLLVDRKRVSEGEPLRVTLEVVQPDGFEVAVPPLAVEGIEATLADEAVEILPAGQQQVRLRYELSGEPGSYVLGPPPALVTDPGGDVQELPISPVFFDLGVDGPAADLEGVLLPEAPESSPWAWWLAGTGLALVGLAGGAWLWRRRRDGDLDPIPEPAHLVAIRQWDATMADPALDHHGRASRLSIIFRRYLEAVHGWPATARTTSEIVRALDRDGLAVSLIEKARRPLSATDLVKFARRGAGEAFFKELDRDFRDYVAGTSPPGEGAIEGEVSGA